MKALLLTAPGELSIAEVDDPVPAPDDALVRVAACGICGSDVHGFTGATGRRIPPLVMGHEAAGTVVAMGAGVTGLEVGTRVAIDSTVFCGACAHCAAGHENLCSRRQVLGVSCGDYRRHGCFAELAAVPRRCLHPLPPGLDFVTAALLEPLTIALHAATLGAAGPATRSAVVVGAGTIGLAAVAALVARGVRRVAAIDVVPARLDRARGMGAAEVFVADRPSVGRLAAAWASATPDDDGADLVIEAVGTSDSVATAVAAAGRGGTVVLVGNVSPTIELPLQAVVTRQLRLQGSCASAGSYPEAIRLAASGAVDLTGFVSAVAPLADGPAWFERLRRGDPGVVKVVLCPSGGFA